MVVVLSTTLVEMPAGAYMRVERTKNKQQPHFSKEKHVHTRCSARCPRVCFVDVTSVNKNIDLLGPVVVEL